MLVCHHIHKRYNIKTILQDVSLTVNEGERVGLIGPNGSGKSTLLRIIAGREFADRGSVQLSPGHIRLGYLAQGFELDPQRSLGDIVADVMPSADVLEARLGELGVALATTPDDADLIAAYDLTLRQLTTVDERKQQEILDAMGLDQLELTQPAGWLSGGQQTRLALACLLLDEPDVLLLDEPTNHLDIDMLEWLERWLDETNRTALIVSHDRAFLDNCVNRIVALDPNSRTVRSYAGNYSDYIDQFTAEQDKQWSRYREQQAEIRRMRQDINRTKEQARWVERTTTPRQPNVRRLAKKVAQKAKSREKKLERYLEDEERVEKPLQAWQMKLAFDEMVRLGDDVLTTQQLAVGYASLPLLTELSLTVQAGERIVITGANGAGKTTLLKTLAGKLAPLHGQTHWGYSVRLGYMAQLQDTLEPDEDAVTTIQRVLTTPLTETEIRSYLHFFLFKDEAPKRPTQQLSYGERSRLMLAKLVAQGCNVLLLDEPINHLDIPSRTRFEQALSQFHGTVIAVVHDRYFVERFATQVWEVDGGQVKRYLMRSSLST